MNSKKTIEESKTWFDIPGYEGIYQISKEGRVKSLKRTITTSNNRMLPIKEVIRKSVKCSKGYYSVNLSKKNKASKEKIHKLMAITFLDHNPCGHKIVIDHINNNPSDNRLENIQLIKNRENLSKDKIGSSKFTGVIVSKKGYIYSQINLNGKQYHLGSFKSEDEAYAKYKEALKSFENLGVLPKPKIYSSKYKGICFDKRINKWRSSIKIKGKLIYLGVFTTEELAKEKRDKYITEDSY